MACLFMILLWYRNRQAFLLRERKETMKRKRITQRFPWLLPIRKKQRIFCFYLKMALDGRHYASRIGEEPFAHLLYTDTSPLYNKETGFDMIYQENKVFNLKLAAAVLNNLVIRPHETFSFWHLVRHADSKTPFRDGLTVTDGELKTTSGGGLCQMSNLLFWLFLHTPLLIVERHGHAVKHFPDPSGGLPAGVDAAVSEGWLDLKVRNDTEFTFQLRLAFTEEDITGSIFTDTDTGKRYEVANGEISFENRDEGLFEKADVLQRVYSSGTGECLSEKRLYTNCCEIGYPLQGSEEGISMIDNMKSVKKQVAVIFGGCSPEYQVSLASAYAVISHMDREKFVPVPVGISPEGDWFLFRGEPEKIREDIWCNPQDCTPAAFSLNRSEHSLLVLMKEGGVEKRHIDVVFPVLHGKNGEDGTVQGVFELAGIPLAGCGVLASALCMDKDRAHKLAAAAGVTVPASFVLHRGEPAPEAGEPAEKLGYPVFVKPLRAGSSFGITRVTEPEKLSEAVEEAFRYDDTVIVEAAVTGFEVGCAVMGRESLTVGEVDEIELSKGFFDYTEKYTLQSSAIHVPARVDGKTARRIKSTAQTIYRALDCRGFARVDLFLTEKGEIVFNEVNTIPGFTSHSRFPNMMRAAGISFEEVISEAIETAVTV